MVSLVEGFKDQYDNSLADPGYTITCEGIIVIGVGYEYTVTIESKDDLIAFINSDIYGNFDRDPVSNELFLDGSVFNNDFDEIRIQLRNDGYSEADAWAYALAYVMDKYDMGLKINMRDEDLAPLNECKLKETKETDKKGKVTTKYKPDNCK